MRIDLQYQTQLLIGLFEREIYRHLVSLSQGIRCAVDVGAADGEFTLYFLDKTPAIQVLAFESSLQAVRRLEQNLHLNGYDVGRSHVVVVRKFLSDFRDDRHCTLDEFKSDIVHPCLVKIDVDGGELAVLRGASELLSRPSTRWIIETHSRELEKDCLAVLHEYGYSTTVVRNAWWRRIIPESRSLESNRWLVAARQEKAQ